MPASLAPGAGGRKFRAFNKATGAMLWETELPAGTTGAPMTYMFEGKQYVIVAIGSSLSGPSLAGLVSFAAGVDEQGAVLGVYSSMGSLARAIGPLLGGLAFDHISHSSPMWIGGAVVTLAALIAIQLPRSVAKAPALE